MKSAHCLMAVLLLLTSCGSTTTPAPSPTTSPVPVTVTPVTTPVTTVPLPNIAKFVADVNLLASALEPVLNAIKTSNIDPDLITKAEQALAVIQTDASLISNKLPSAPPVTVAQEVIDAVTAIAAVAETIPSVAPFAILINAALSLTPDLLSLAGIHLNGRMIAIMPVNRAKQILQLSIAVKSH